MARKMTVIVLIIFYLCTIKSVSTAYGERLDSCLCGSNFSAVVPNLELEFHRRVSSVSPISSDLFQTCIRISWSRPTGMVLFTPRPSRSIASCIVAGLLLSSDKVEANPGPLPKSPLLSPI